MIRGLTLLWFLAIPPLVHALASTGPVDSLLRAVSYDRSLKARAPEGLRLGIVFLADPASREDADRFFQAAEALRKAKAPHAPIYISRASFQSELALGRWCESEQLSALYVATGFDEEQLPTLAAAAHGAGVITLSASARAVEHGLAVGIDAQSGETKVLIHMAAAQSAGADFDSRLLQIARRVGPDPPPATVGLREEIAETLARYRQAIGERDVAGLRQVWPSLSDEEIGRIQASFAFARSYEISIALLTVEGDASRARARVLRADVLTAPDGKRVVSRSLSLISLEQGAGGWLIGSMGRVVEEGSTAAAVTR
jgi:hypothetical protein